jgi:hypothetical protein
MFLAAELHRRGDPRELARAGSRTGSIPDASQIEPRVGVLNFIGVQLYKLVLVAEKASAESVLVPIAERHEADLSLPSGRISDTLTHRMAKTGSQDGRPMVVLYFSDCGPAGWNTFAENVDDRADVEGLHSTARRRRAAVSRLRPGRRFSARFGLGRTVRVYSVGRRCDTGATEGTSYAGSRVGAVRGVRHPVRRLPEIG